jgi:hypothetical protein
VAVSDHTKAELFAMRTAIGDVWGNKGLPAGKRVAALEAITTNPFTIICSRYTLAVDWMDERRVSSARVRVITPDIPEQTANLGVAAILVLMSPKFGFSHVMGERIKSLRRSERATFLEDDL